METMTRSQFSEKIQVQVDLIRDSFRHRVDRSMRWDQFVIEWANDYAEAVAEIIEETGYVDKRVIWRGLREKFPNYS